MVKQNYIKAYGKWRAGQDEKISKLIVEIREIKDMLNHIANELWGADDGKKK